MRRAVEAEEENERRRRRRRREENEEEEREEGREEKSLWSLSLCLHVVREEGRSVGPMEWEGRGWEG